MNKDVAINSVLTPTGNRDFARQALGESITPVAERISPGSLLSGLLAASILPLCVLIAPNSVLAYEMDGVFTVGDVISAITPISSSSHLFGALPSQSKSKSLEVTGVFVAVTVLDGSNFAITDPFLLGILSPQSPTYTALSLVNRLETIAIAQGVGYVIIVDQITENVHLYLFSDMEAADDALAAARVANGSPIKAAFDTPIAPISPSSPTYGWE